MKWIKRCEALYIQRTSQFYWLFPPKICMGGALDRFKNLPMNVHTYIHTHLAMCIHTYMHAHLSLVWVITCLFNLEAGKECEGVDGCDRMSAASYTLIELKRSATLVPASLFVQGQARGVDGLPYIEIWSIVIGILQIGYFNLQHIFCQWLLADSHKISWFTALQ